jgi:site-specific DNA-methyltransferase (adenine-specific)
LVAPYYADDLVTIYHGSALDVAPFVDVALTIADPPYGQTSLEWDRWVSGWPANMPGSSMWCFGTLRMFMDHADDFTAGRWKLSQDIVWEKHNGSGFAADRFRRVHESVAHFYRGKWGDVPKIPQVTMDATARTVRSKRRPAHTGNIDPTPYKSIDGGPRLMRSVLQVRSTHGYAENETQKPIGIIAPLIAYGCPLGGTVFDPFMGAGSVLVAAKLAGCRAIGVDVREDQCEIAARRCSQEVLGLVG